jgi:GTP-binding protein EngB required for normal cell division
MSGKLKWYDILGMTILSPVIVPVAAALSVYEAATGHNPLNESQTESGNESKKEPDPHRILKMNLSSLKNALSGADVVAMKRIAIIGAPGAGKSSLIISLTNNEIIPIPKVGITTDATDWSKEFVSNIIGLYKNNYIVDVPGYDTKSHPLELYLNYFPFSLFDIFVFVLRGKISKADEVIYRIKKLNKNKYIVVARLLDDQGDALQSEIESDLQIHLDENVTVEFFSNQNYVGIDVIRMQLGFIEWH